MSTRKTNASRPCNWRSWLVRRLVSQSAVEFLDFRLFCEQHSTVCRCAACSFQSCLTASLTGCRTSWMRKRKLKAVTFMTSRLNRHITQTGHYGERRVRKRDRSSPKQQKTTEHNKRPRKRGRPLLLTLGQAGRETTRIEMR